MANELAAQPPGAEPRRTARPRIFTAVAAVALGSALVLGGCSQGKDACLKQLDQLRADIVQLRAESLALQDRIAELEDRGQSAAPAKPPADQAVDRPQLKVIRLTPIEAPAPDPGATPTDSAGAEAAADSSEPPLDLRLDDEPGTSKTYRSRSAQPTTRPAYKR